MSTRAEQLAVSLIGKPHRTSRARHYSEPASSTQNTAMLSAAAAMASGELHQQLSAFGKRNFNEAHVSMPPVRWQGRRCRPLGRSPPMPPSETLAIRTHCRSGTEWQPAWHMTHRTSVPGVIGYLYGTCEVRTADRPTAGSSPPVNTSRRGLTVVYRNRVDSAVRHPAAHVGTYAACLPSASRSRPRCCATSPSARRSFVRMRCILDITVPSETPMRSAASRYFIPSMAM
jgi:hypothetical protein